MTALETTARSRARPLAPSRRLPLLVPYLLISPSIVLLLALIAFPLLFALNSSFYFWNLQRSPDPMRFMGLTNYDMALSGLEFLPR